MHWSVLDACNAANLTSIIHKQTKMKFFTQSWHFLCISTPQYSTKQPEKAGILRALKSPLIKNVSINYSSASLVAHTSTSFKTTKTFVVSDKKHIHAKEERNYLLQTWSKKRHITLKKAMLLCAEIMLVVGNQMAVRPVQK